MTFLFDCPNDVCLPATYDLVEEVENFLHTTKLLEIRDTKIEGVTVEEQGKKNLKAMLFKVCKEYPEEAGRICDKLWVLDKPDEKIPNALLTFAKVITRRDAMDFFTSLMALAQ